MNAAAITCPYCNRAAKYFASSACVYRGRDYGPIWACIKCDAYCGCHPNGLPLGQLADKELRVARMRVHSVFDALWRGDLAQRLAYPEETRPNKKLIGVMRGRAYSWLAHHMAISVADCHTARFDLAKCEHAVSVLKQHQPTSATIREWRKQIKAQETAA